jgi:hypothetical protein
MLVQQKRAAELRIPFYEAGHYHLSNTVVLPLDFPPADVCTWFISEH